MTDKKDLSDDTEVQAENRDERDAADTAPLDGDVIADNGDPAQEASTYEQTIIVEADDVGGQRRTLLTMVILVLVAFLFGMAGAAYWAWTELEVLRADLAVVSEDASSRGQALTDARATDSAALRQQLDTQNERVEARITEIDGTVAALNLRLSASEQAEPHALVMAEVEYLLNLASNRLSLERDRPGALLAMDRALARLEDADTPVYAILGATIAAERASLEALEVPDATAILARLSALVSQVDDIEIESEKLTPDAGAPVVDEAAGQSWQSVVAAIAGNLGQLVTIQRADGVSAPTLIPDANYYARENVRLALKNARSSMLRNDAENVAWSLHEATRWLTQLPVEDGAVANIRAEVSALLELELDVAYPSLTGALAVARQLSADPKAQAPESVDVNQDEQAADPTTADAAAADGNELANDIVEEALAPESELDELAHDVVVEPALEAIVEEVEQLDESQQ